MYPGNSPDDFPDGEEPTTEGCEFMAPSDGGWHYTMLRDWIAVCDDLTPTDARVYWIIRSIMHEKGDKKRRLSIDQLCFLLPGINGKPTGETRVKDALRNLERIGLLSNPDGDVVRRWVFDQKTGKQRRENFRRWQIHDYPDKRTFPDDNYPGWRSALAKLDSYPGPRWRNDADLPNRSGPGHAESRKSAAQRTESRKSASSRRKSASSRRKSGDFEAVTSDNEGSKEVLQGSSLRNNPSPPVPRSDSHQPPEPDVNEEGGEDTRGGLFGMGEILPAKTSAPPSEGEPSKLPGRQKPDTRGGELVTKHGYDAAQVIENWKNGLNEPSAITGRLEKDLIKGVRGILAESPLCEERALIDTLNEYMRNGKTPKYLPIAYRSVLQERARAANPRFAETDRQRTEREHYERTARGERPEPASLAQARQAAWGSELRTVPTVPGSTLWCEQCDPDNPGWLPQVDPTDPHETQRRCPNHRGRRLKPSPREVRDFASQRFSERYRDHHGLDNPGTADGGVMDAEIVD